ncbi:cohesin loading factor [Bombardia bombarda]|uniref:Cohesin loading factor n=1 Tax=Bombardia bombarda TaxID=252184 RepID=A0AA39XK69_9PEZI|nr:cohesin loading factor [Bombardia bombarda]
MSPQISAVPQQLPQQQQLQQPSSAKNSPRLDDRRTLPHPSSVKAQAKDQRRQSSASAVAKSPVLSNASAHVETLPLLLCVAEDCFSKANAASQDVAKSMSANAVKEHHKLVATGLACLEIAMKSNKLWPRLEARLCLRYASILTEETTNLMEAETALTRGIAVCEKHRFVDLKYSSEFLLMKTLLQRNQKAAFKSLDTHIASCTTYKHIHWVYAFRFLKAAFHLQAGTAADHHAVENLRKIAEIANQRGEKAIFVMAMLLEGLAHLSTGKDDWTTRVQTCIAQASKLQLDDSVHLPQIDVLLLLLDLACSLRQKSHQLSGQKLNALQTKLDELRHSPDWASLSNEVLLPINRSPNASQTISNDTRAILRPGNDRVDYLVLSALGKQESYALAYVFHGIVALYKATTLGRSSSIWNEAIRLLEDSKPVSATQSLPEALKQSGWAKELICYAHVLVGLQAATLSDWARVKKCLQMIEESEPAAGFLDVMILYLKGVLCQGTAKLTDALQIWNDKRFDIGGIPGSKTNASHIDTELSILAALNRLWIMQAPTHQDMTATYAVMDGLRLLCEENPDIEIRTAYNLVLASIALDPPLSINQVKRHIQLSLAGAQQSSNTQCLSIALNIMRCRLFENVVGEQALKSAKAGSAQARKSGNLLWMSVADGMLAQSHEMQGAIAEARATRESGVRLANEALSKTEV